MPLHRKTGDQNIRRVLYINITVLKLNINILSVNHSLLCFGLVSYEAHNVLIWMLRAPRLVQIKAY